MKKVTYSPANNQAGSSSSSYATVDAVPDIANRYLDVKAIVSWLDRLVEVHDNEANTSNK